MAFPASVPGLRPALRRPGDIRAGRVLSTLVISTALIVGAMHLAPVMSAGADLANAGQRNYASNIWQEVRVSLVAIALFLPWLSYALLWRGARWGSRLLVAVTMAGSLAGTWLTLVGVDSYAALPRAVTGVVNRIDGRTVWLEGPPGSYYLVLSDSQLARTGSLLRAGRAVTLWVSPRGQVGDVEPGQ